MVGTTAGISKLRAQKLEAERVERVRAEERKAHAGTTTEILKQRYGIIAEDE